ncbi:MAG: diaminopimelate decarboxylase [Rhodospirillales bacterium]|jgi:diaminopimelate decarboxylase|nr:diaminopimelate decarboxylase [Rhodospirillales bacterium]
MDHFQYTEGRLHAEAVPLERIAETVGTPFYCYSSATLERHFKAFETAFADMSPTICFAVKSNSNVAVLRFLAGLGAGGDVVSGGETTRALAAGVPADRIVYSGVGKTADEIAAALKADIWQINIESEPELETVARVAESLGITATIGIRINPDVDANTHAKISTGKAENKFGIDWIRTREVYAQAAKMPHIHIVGLALHIGSQLLDLDPFRAAYSRMAQLVGTLRADGQSVERLDLGGGLGIGYGPNPSQTPADYAQVVRAALGDLGCELTLEPGRAIAGNAGVLVTKVIFVKEGATRDFVIVDAAMNDLMRPALYDAHHDIVPVAEPVANAHLTEMDVVGPICETGDTFATNRPLPEVKSGDLLAFRTAGAYGAVMASMYNARALPPEVLVKDDAFHVVRQRIGVDDMLARESVPDWLTDP